MATLSNLLTNIPGYIRQYKAELEADKAVYKRMLVFLQPYRKRFIIGLLASIPASTLEGLTSFFAGPFLDRLIQGGDYTFLLYIPLVIIAFSIVQGIFEYLSQYCTTYVSNRISVDIQSQLYTHLIGMDLGFYKRNTYGDITTRFYSDAQKLQQAIVTNLQGLLIQFFTMITLAGVLFYRNWQLSFVAIGIISLIVIPLAYISKRIRALDYVNRQASASVGNLYNETIYGVREVKSFGMSNFLQRRFAEVRQKVLGVTMDTAKKNIILSPIMQVIASVGIGAIIFLGTIYVQRGMMTPGDLASFLLALLLLYKPVKVVGSTIGKISVILAPAERVFEVLDMSPGLHEPEEGVKLDKFESLEFRNVCFSYPVADRQYKGHLLMGDSTEKKQVLHDIDLTINAGEVIGIVGGSGGGKSTLVDLVSRFIDPSCGQVLMNGIDLHELNIRSLREKIAMVSQDTMMFAGTIRENIIIGKLNATEEEMAEALRVAHLTDWVKSLPEGVNSEVGDRGGFLSGGQKQRIAIARAYLKQAPILVLDEATSALDNESEAAVQAALMDLMVGKTVIMIAHRLSTVRHANRILVLEDGRIIESGTHDELMELEGVYCKLYSLQFRTSSALRS